MILISIGMWRLPEFIEWFYKIASLGTPVFSRDKHWSMFLVILAVAIFCILFDAIRLIVMFFHRRS